MRDCRVSGHVFVMDDGPECLACGKTLTLHDRVSVVVGPGWRGQGELQNPLDVASLPEWGGNGTAPE